MKTLKEFFAGEKKKEMTGPEVHNKGNKVAEPKTRYQCPMKCEGDKTYEAPGNCPVCNMKLVSLENKSSHNHKHHGCC